tara:strand:- start:97 stop:303 length:207 start_codon:yes stop_codon:yes gene_type:complete
LKLTIGYSEYVSPFYHRSIKTKGLTKMIMFNLPPDENATTKGRTSIKNQTRILRRLAKLKENATISLL